MKHSNTSENLKAKILGGQRPARYKKTFERNKPPPISNIDSSADVGLTPEKKNKNKVLEFLENFEQQLGYLIPKDSAESLACFFKEKMTQSISLSLQDLHEAIHSLLEIISKVENFSQKTFKLSLAEKDFIIKVNDFDIPTTNKTSLASFLSLDPQYHINPTSPSFLPESVIDLSRIYENSMTEAFMNDKCTKIVKERSKALALKSRLILDIQLSTLKQSQKDQQRIRQDIEWQKHEIKLIKSQMKLKRAELIQKDNNLITQLSSLKTRRVSLAHEHERLEQQLDVLEGTKIKIKELINYLSTINTELNCSQSIETNDTDNKSPTLIQEEIKSLDIELKSLETQLKKSPKEDHDSLYTQIYRIKTKISSLKSVNIINATLTSTKSAKNIMSNLSKIYSINPATPIKSSASIRSGFTSPYSPTCNGVLSLTRKDKVRCASLTSTMKTERSSSASLEFYQEKDEDKNFNLPQKEARLLEKEEDFSLQELNKESYTGKVDHDSDKFSLNSIKKVYEIRQRQLENKHKEVDAIKRRFEEDQSEIIRKINEVDTERHRVEAEKSAFMSRLELIKEYLQAFLNDLQS